MKKEQRSISKVSLEKRMELASAGARKGVGNVEEAPAGKADQSTVTGSGADSEKPSAVGGADSDSADSKESQGSSDQGDSSGGKDDGGGSEEASTTTGSDSSTSSAKAGDEGTGDSSTDTDDASNAKVEKSSVRELLESGDLRKLAELTGASFKKVDASNVKFSILNRKMKKLEKDNTELRQRAMFVQQKEGQLKAREQELGDPTQVRKDFEEKNYHKVGKYFEKQLGYSFTTITQRMARHNAGMSKEKLAELEERENFEREKREFEENKKKQEEAAKKATEHQSNLTTVRKKLADHPAAKLKGGSEAVLKILEDHWDEDIKGLRGGMNLQKAAEMVLSNVVGYMKETAPLLGFEVIEKGSSAAGKGRQSPASTPTKKQDTPAPAEKKKTGKLSLEERMALADKRSQRRRAV